MGQKFDKLRLLMWKNFLLHYRNTSQTFNEIMFPVLVVGFLLYGRYNLVPKQYDSSVYSPFCTLPLNITGICNLTMQPYLQNFMYHDLIYSPSTPAVDDVMYLFSFLFRNVTGLPNSTEIDSYYKFHGSNSTFAALQFDDSLARRDDLGPDQNVKLSIRFPADLRSNKSNWETNLLFPTINIAGPRNRGEQTGGNPRYYQEGFLTIQHLVSIFITWKNSGVDTSNITALTDLEAFIVEHPLPFINMRRFPHSSYYLDIYMILLKVIAGYILTMAFMNIFLNTVIAINHEKDTQLKESMKMMGVPNWLLWTSWFLKTVICMMLTCVIMVIILKVKWFKTTHAFGVFTYANVYVVLLLFFCYTCATTTFCFALTVSCSGAHTTSLIAILVWFAPDSIYMLYVNAQTDPLSPEAYLVTSLVPILAMRYGIEIIAMYEESGEGVQFNNIWKPFSEDDNLSLGIVMVMLAFDCLLYLLIALYVEAVFPGEYGVPQKWYFPFKKSFWCGEPKYIGVEDFNTTDVNEGEDYEAEPKNLHAGIKIRNLGKSIGANAVVRNISLNLYENQITVLLGPNGAGKTTTMSMLIGLFPPSSGTAIVNGYDIRTDMNGVRNSLGICPQQDIIFDDLTVAEHFYFFSKLKGLRGNDVDAEITKYVNMLGLESKRNEKSMTLSGGMKRKLCVGVALCGNSKIVMLDEPTSGMDPSARRALWNILLELKTGRTILLTTHFMDEADLLGDRIAIMAGGELQCCGSSFFLKKKYGLGYRLIMEKNNKCISQRVTTLLRKYIPNIDIHSNVGAELTYLLAESQSHIFKAMLRDLEQNLADLGVNSYGISLTTLEEVFLRVESGYGQKKMYKSAGNNTQPQTPANASGCRLLFNQVMAMTMKRILSTIRSWRLLMIQFFTPIILILMFLLREQNTKTIEDLPAMPLTLSKYIDPVILVDGNNMSSGYGDIYKGVVGTAYKEVDSINDTIMQLTAETPTTVRKFYLGGASFNPMNDSIRSQAFDVNFTVYFNNDPLHTPGVVLGLALNTMYRKIVGCTNNCGIEFVNYPLPYSFDTQITKVQNTDTIVSGLALNIGLSMSLSMPIFIIFIIRERVSKSKHLQFASGMKCLIFWMVTWFWDFIIYIIIIIALLITLVCFGIDGLKSTSEIGRLFLIFLYFGWCLIPMIYLAGFIFKVPAGGYSDTATACVIGIAPIFIIQLHKKMERPVKKIWDMLHKVFLIVPHYSMATGIRDVYTTYFYNKMCNSYYDACWEQCPECTIPQCLDLNPTIKSQCEDACEDYFKWATPGIGQNIVYSVSTGAILMIVLFLLEYKVFSKIIYAITGICFSKKPEEVPNEDDDVRAEKDKIRNMPQKELIQNYTMVMKDLTKCYAKVSVVNGVSLGINNFECFGLLGANGAGKTTTFKMLTGDTYISYGDAWVNGKSIKHQIKEVHNFIGYCPQFDALLDDLTARETLIMFALIRGIPFKDCGRTALRFAAEFDYHNHLDKQVKELSGGTKRKLSTSIALIGDPLVIYLDEPTTGMDPGTKRNIWNALCQVRDSGRTIVLTSHNMEECEALCTKLAIMANGNLKCLGSLQHLKSKFSKGYTIAIKVKNADETYGIMRFMQENIPGCVLREKHEELLIYYVIDTTVPLSGMFGILEDAKRRNDLNIEDYSLGQSSLEQVFLSFSQQQSE